MSDWLPSLNALRAFEATARHRSYKKAADELLVTPAAIKQLVTKLEEAIGEPLLERRGRSVELTRTGAQGSSDLQSAFRQISFAVERMRASHREDRLVVSVDPSFASAWLVPRLQNFKVLHPDIEILVSSSMMIAALDDGITDVGIRFGVSHHGDHVTHRLFDEDLRALCSPLLAEGPPRITRLEDLERSRLLRWDISDFSWAKTTQKWNYWRTWLSAVGAGHIKPGPGAKFNDYNIAVQAAIGGQGFILGSYPVLRNLIRSGLLIDPFGASADPKIGYDIVTTRAAMERSNVRKFIDWTLAAAKD